MIEALATDARRQPYRITSAGTAALGEHLDALERISSVGRTRLGFAGA